MTRPILVESRLAWTLTIPDPLIRYRELEALGTTVEDLRVEVERGRSGCARELRAAGMTWSEVGERLGLSLQGAQQLATRD